MDANEVKLVINAITQFRREGRTKKLKIKWIFLDGKAYPNIRITKNAMSEYDD